MKNFILTLALIAILAGSIIPHNFASAISPVGTVTATINVGGAPRGMAFNPNNGYIYVANSGSNNVSVINSADNSIVATIPVGAFPVDVVFNPTNGYLYVANHFGGSVTVINGATNTVVTTIVTGGFPNGVEFNPNNGYIYVAVDGNYITVINGATNTFVTNIPASYGPNDLTFNPNNGNLYSMPFNQNFAYIINGATNTQTGSFFVGFAQDGSILNPTNGHLYIFGDGGLRAFNTATNLPIGGPLISGNAVYGAAHNPDNQYVYAALSNSNSVSVLDVSTNTVAGTISVGNNPWDVLFTPTNHKIYVSNLGSNTLSVITIPPNPPSFSQNITPVFSGPTCLQMEAEEPGIHYWFIKPDVSGTLAINVNAVAVNPVSESGNIVATLFDGATNLGTVTVLHPVSPSPVGSANTGSITFSADPTKIYRLEVSAGAMPPLPAQQARHYSLEVTGGTADLGINSPSQRYFEHELQAFHLNVGAGESMSLKISVDSPPANGVNQATSVSFDIRDSTNALLLSQPSTPISSASPITVTLPPAAVSDSRLLLITGDGHFRISKTSGIDTGLYADSCPPKDGTACSDENACTTGDLFLMGQCTPGTPIPTDDNNVCTADSCDPITGPSHSPLVCVDDGNVCTVEACDPVTGCFTANVADGTTCGDNMACSAGQCIVKSSTGKVTAGGAQVDKNTNFGLNVQSDGLIIKGTIEYQDKSANINLHSISMTSLSIDPTKTKATFTGTAKLNNSPGYTFKVYVEDNGEPGRTDKFTIKINENSYTKSGTLQKGNIQIHK